MSQKILITGTIETERYFLSLIKKRSQLVMTVKRGFSKLPCDQEELGTALEDLSTVDSIIKIIENNFTFYKEDK